MRAIMADNDILGQMRILVQLLESDVWRDLWVATNLSVRTFADLGLTPDVSDAVLWHACQKEQIVLITGNRIKESAISLQATIEAHNTSSSLPVFTLSNANRILASRRYANQVVERMLRYLLEIDNVRGAGRLWLP